MQLTALLFAVICSGLRAEGMVSGASLSAPFENTASSARAAGMGGALYFSDSDTSLVIQNPAALSAIKLPQVSLHHNNWIADILQEVVVLGLPIGDPKTRGSLGLTANYVNYGHFQGRDETGRVTGALGASDLGLSVGYGRHLLGALSGGFSFKTLQQTLADQSYTTYSADFGLLLNPHPNVCLSAAYANLGSSVGGSQRATVLRLGAAGVTEFGSEAGFRFGVGVNLRPQGSNQFNVGVEFELNKMFSLRSGYSLPLQDIEIGGLNNIAFGAGLKVEPLSVDYAYLPFGELGNVQRVSIGYSFGNPAPVAVAPPPPSRTHAPPPALPVPTLPVASPTKVPQAASPAEDLEFVIKVPDKDLSAAREFAKQGSYKEAVAAYGSAIQHSPEDAVAWRELADLYFKLGKRNFALRCYEEVVKLQPENTELAAWIESVRGKIE